MISWYELDCNQIRYTYRQDNMSVCSLIDHFRVQQSLLSNICSYSVIDEGSKMLYHLFVTCIIECGSKKGRSVVEAITADAIR